MKTIQLTRSSTPDKLGFYDNEEIYDDNNNALYLGPCSTNPNPYHVDAATGVKVPWNKFYGWLAPGKYTATCMVNEKFGKCFAINNGLRVPSKTPNPQHNGEMYLVGVFIHHAFETPPKGFPGWRGSAGCVTIPEEEVGQFFSYFKVGEVVNVELTEEFPDA